MKIKLFTKENLLALIFALILSFSIINLNYNFNFLQWDISWVKNENTKTNQEIKWDVFYEIKWDNLILSSNKNISWVKSLNFNVFYDISKVKLNFENIDSKYEMTSTNTNDWLVNLIIMINWDINSWDELIKVNFEWDESNLTISDVSVLLDNWLENLSIESK